MPVIAAFPNAIPAFSAKVDNVDTVFADHINILQAEVAAIATALGTQPAGVSGTVKQRMADIEAMHTVIESHFDSNGLVPQAGVVGLPAEMTTLNAIAALFTAPGGLLPQSNVYGLVSALAPLATAVSATLVDAKGDLLVGTANDVLARLAVGPNANALMADSTATGGVSWQPIHFAIPFHFSNTLTAGVKAPSWIAPKNATLLLARARAASGSGATYQVFVNGASVTATSAAVGGTVVLNDFTDVAISTGDYVQISIIAAGTAADMSVTIDAIWR